MTILSSLVGNILLLSEGLGLNFERELELLLRTFENLTILLFVSSLFPPVCDGLPLGGGQRGGGGRRGGQHQPLPSPQEEGGQYLAEKYAMNRNKKQKLK